MTIYHAKKMCRFCSGPCRARHNNGIIGPGFKEWDYVCLHCGKSQTADNEEAQTTVGQQAKVPPFVKADRNMESLETHKSGQVHPFLFE